MTQRTIGQNLAAIMHAQGISALQLSRQLAISRNRIGDILKDRTKPDFFTMKVLRKALNIPPEEATGVFFPGLAENSGYEGRSP